jgi:hypothetical protein
MKRTLQIIYILLLSFLSCKKKNEVIVNGNGNNNNGDTIKLYEYNILPSSTNPNIISYNNEYEVCYDNRTTLLNKLFVFLPGTTGSPSYYKLIVQKASSLGYHAIGLMYPNNSDLYTSAAASSNLDEFGKCRQEIFDGSDQTSGVNVNADNCIKSRLYKLLIYLQSQYPNQNWGQYIINYEVNWSKCVIAGHSQGGGHAFYIAKQVLVDKAISFSSIDWNSSLSASASWVSQPGATPISKYYSFNGIRDQIFAYGNVQTQLTDMGLQGPAVSIDSNTPLYSNSHCLTTAATPAISLLFPDHNITSLDSYVPKDANGKVITSFDKAWEYLLIN